MRTQPDRGTRNDYKRRAGHIKDDGKGLVFTDFFSPVSPHLLSPLECYMGNTKGQGKLLKNYLSPSTSRVNPNILLGFPNGSSVHIHTTRPYRPHISALREAFSTCAVNTSLYICFRLQGSGRGHRSQKPAGYSMETYSSMFALRVTGMVKYTAS